MVDAVLHNVMVRLSRVERFLDPESFVDLTGSHAHDEACHTTHDQSEAARGRTHAQSHYKSATQGSVGSSLLQDKRQDRRRVQYADKRMPTTLARMSQTRQRRHVASSWGVSPEKVKNSTMRSRRFEKFSNSTMKSRPRQTRDQNRKQHWQPCVRLLYKDQPEAAR